MSDHLYGWNIMQKFPIDWKKSPERVRANTIPNTFVHFAPLAGTLEIFD
jgi:hypothetical protein